jgi:hypothetical protein
MAFDLDNVTGWFNRTMLNAQILVRSFLDDRLMCIFTGYLIVEKEALNTFPFDDIILAFIFNAPALFFNRANKMEKQTSKFTSQCDE